MAAPMWLNLNADTTGISIAQQGGRAGSRLIEQGTPCRFHLFPLRVSPQGWGYKDQSTQREMGLLTAPHARRTVLAVWPQEVQNETRCRHVFATAPSRSGSR
jgi:hypothetical protein